MKPTKNSKETVECSRFNGLIPRPRDFNLYPAVVPSQAGPAKIQPPPRMPNQGIVTLSLTPRFNEVWQHLKDDHGFSRFSVHRAHSVHYTPSDQIRLNPAKFSQSKIEFRNSKIPCPCLSPFNLLTL